MNAPTKCDVTGIGLLPNGFVDAKTTDQIRRCPWFWSSKLKQWFRRPQWLPMLGQPFPHPWDLDKDFV